MQCPARKQVFGILRIRLRQFLTIRLFVDQLLHETASRLSYYFSMQTISWKRNAIYLVPIAVGFLWVSATLRPSGFLNHDVAWFTMVGGKVLGGAQLYRDYIEANAPLASLAMAPAAILNSLTGLALPAAVTIWVYLIIALGFLMTVGTLRRVPLTQARTILLQALILMAMIFAPSYDFGQREHLFAVLATPYAIAAALRNTPGAVTGGFAAIIGIVAAMGAGMKPPLILAILAIEVVSLVRTRRLLHYEFVALAAALGIYVFLTWILFPDFFRIVGGWGTGLYAAYGIMPNATLRMVILMFLGLAPMLWRNPPPAPEIEAMRWMTAAAALGAFASYLLQWKGWWYQGFPALYFALLCCVISIVAFARPTGIGLVRGLAGVLLATAIYAHALVVNKYHVKEGTRQLRPILSKVDGPFMALSTAVSSGFPHGAEHPGGWAFRYPCLILVPGLVQAAAENGGILPKRYRVVEDTFRAAIVEDIRRHAPAVIVIPRGWDTALPEGFKIFDWLMADADFVAIFSAYTETNGTEKFRVFERRRDGN
jgi:hypothetical protein